MRNIDETILVNKSLPKSMNKELWRREQGHMLDAMAREMTGCKNRLI